MKPKSILVVGIIWFVIQPLSTPWAIEIVRPAQDTVVHPGDTVTIEVVPSPGEHVETVIFNFLEEKEAMDNTPPYEYHYKVGPHEFSVLKISIIAMKPESEGPFVSEEPFPSADAQVSSHTELRLLSIPPPATVMKEIRAEIDNGREDGQKKGFMTLYQHDNGKLILTRFGISMVDTWALYSNGVERSITEHPDTTYISSDEKIVKVTPPGEWVNDDKSPEYLPKDKWPGDKALVTAVGPGTAKIIVRHGPYEDSVTGIVNVEPCNEWKKTRSSKTALPVCD